MFNIQIIFQIPMLLRGEVVHIINRLNVAECMTSTWVFEIWTCPRCTYFVQTIPEPVSWRTELCRIINIYTIVFGIKSWSRVPEKIDHNLLPVAQLGGSTTSPRPPSEYFAPSRPPIPQLYQDILTMTCGLTFQEFPLKWNKILEGYPKQVYNRVN